MVINVGSIKEVEIWFKCEWNHEEEKIYNNIANNVNPDQSVKAMEKRTPIHVPKVKSDASLSKDDLTWKFENGEYKLCVKVLHEEDKFKKNKRLIKITRRILKLWKERPEEFIDNSLKLCFYNRKQKEYLLMVKHEVPDDDCQKNNMPLEVGIVIVHIFDKYNNYKCVKIRGVERMKWIFKLNETKQKVYVQISVLPFKQYGVWKLT